MDEKQVVRKIMWDKRISQEEIAQKTGMTNQSAVSAKLRTNAMKVDALCGILSVMGYELVIRAKDGSEEYVVRGEGK